MVELPFYMHEETAEKYSISEYLLNANSTTVGKQSPFPCGLSHKTQGVYNQVHRQKQTIKK